MKKTCILFLILWIGLPLFAQKPIRVGTTAAEFLSVGYGAVGCAMGDAYVSVVDDISGIYWNPAGLAFMEQSQTLFTYQPWIAEINTFFVATGLVLPGIGMRVTMRTV